MDLKETGKGLVQSHLLVNSAVSTDPCHMCMSLAMSNSYVMVLNRG